MVKNLWYLYSRAIAGGGAIATSTAAGGGLNTTTAAGGAVISTTAAGGGVVSTETGDNIWKLRGEYGIDVASPVGRHDHGITPGTQLALAEGGAVTWREAHDHSHGLEAHYHRFSLPDHVHGLTLPNHVHGVASPDHTHNISLPNHTHEIEHGIFLGPMPTAVTVEVDGIIVADLGLNAESVDITEYLEKDENGKIIRGWHEVKITPNNLGRIVSSLTSQFFVQSRGGGDY